MSNFFTPGTYFAQPTDFPKSVKEMIFFPYAAPNNFNALHKRQLFGVKYDTTIALFNQQLPVIGASRECGDSGTGDAFATASYKTWQPEKVGINMSQCWTPFLKSLLAPLVKTEGAGPQPAMLNQSREFIQFLGQFFTKEYWENELWRQYWLSDKSFTAANFPNAPGGAAATATKYNRFNALHKRITTAGAATDVSVYAPLTTAANGAATYAAQVAAMTPAAALELLKALRDRCDIRLKGVKNKVILVTIEVFEAYRNYLQQTSLAAPVVAPAWQALIDGFGPGMVLNFDGIPVVCAYEMSLALNRDFRLTVGVYDENDPTSYVIPNPFRGYIFTPENHMIAVDGDTIMQSFEINYDVANKLVRIEADSQTDTQIAYKQLTAYAL